MTRKQAEMRKNRPARNKGVVRTHRARTETLFLACSSRLRLPPTRRSSLPLLSFFLFWFPIRFLFRSHSSFPIPVPVLVIDRYCCHLPTAAIDLFTEPNTTAQPTSMLAARCHSTERTGGRTNRVAMRFSVLALHLITRTAASSSFVLSVCFFLPAAPVASLPTFALPYGLFIYGDRTARRSGRCIVAFVQRRISSLKRCKPTNKILSLLTFR